MAREVWGTFAVSDHCAARAFVADAMLYDRLVLPVPPANDKSEWERWTAKGWNPQRQQTLIEILRAHYRFTLSSGTLQSENFGHNAWQVRATLPNKLLVTLFRHLEQILPSTFRRRSRV